MQSLGQQLQDAQKECREAQTQLHDLRAAFEEESASMHNLASRHKEERVTLESDKQTLDALVQELTRKAEVCAVPCISDVCQAIYPYGLQFQSRALADWAHTHQSERSCTPWLQAFLKGFGQGSAGGAGGLHLRQVDLK